LEGRGADGGRGDPESGGGVAAGPDGRPWPAPDAAFAGPEILAALPPEPAEGPAFAIPAPASAATPPTARAPPKAAPAPSAGPPVTRADARLGMNRASIASSKAATRMVRAS